VNRAVVNALKKISHLCR